MLTCSLCEPLKERVVGWLRKMSHLALDPAVRVEKCWKKLGGRCILPSPPSVIECIV